jgi:hypothetical protein
MHVGRGNEAVQRAGEAVGRLDTTGAYVDEGRVIGAFGRILIGDPEAALAHLLTVDVEQSPFGLAARATASALVGDDTRAREDADRVVAMGEVSYWDRAIALAAGYAAACHDDRETRRAQLIAAVGGIGDVMVTAYIERLLGRVAVSVVDDLQGDGPASRIVDLGGWADVADQLAARAAQA